MSRNHPWSFDHVVMRGYVTNWKLYISFSKRCMITKLCREVTYDEVKSPIMWPLSHVRSRDKIKTKYFLLNNVCGHQLCRMMTYNEEISPIMSCDSLIMWSHEVTWQNKNKISPLLQNLWPLNLAGWWLMIRETYP